MMCVLQLSLLLATHWALLGPGSGIAQANRLRLLAASQEIAMPDYTYYHTKDSLLQEVDAVVQASPNEMTLEVLSDNDKDYNISMRVVNVQIGGLSSDTADKARILIDFGEHAREYVSSELGLSFLRMLSDPRAIAELMGGGERGVKLLQLLKHVVFKVLPMENERGRELVEGGKLCERKNGRGVDPNRNWEVDWGRKEKDYDPNEEYPGARPFSEPEVRTVLSIARSFQPHVWINVHSGMEAMFTPWDHKGEVPEGAREALHILNTIKDNLFTSACVVGSGGKSVGYLAHGTATDYMYERLKVPMSYTWEIYGDMQAPFNDCFRMFNPVSKRQLERLITLWLRALFRLVELIPSHSALVKEGIFTKLAAGSTQPGSDSSSSGRQQGEEDKKPDTGQARSQPHGSEPGSIEGGLDKRSPTGQLDSGLGHEQVGNVTLVSPLHVLQHSSTGLQLLLVLSCVALVGMSAIACSPVLASKVASFMNWRQQKRYSLLPVTTVHVSGVAAGSRP